MQSANVEIEPVYLDYHATTPLDPGVLEAMRPWLGPACNPHSPHAAGRRAAAAVENASEKVAALVGADPSEVVFTSGATEANNLAIVGAVRGASTAIRHVVTTPIEHKSILDVCDALARTEALEVTHIPVIRGSGLVDPDRLAQALRIGATVLVSVAAVNNEVGVIQPVRAIGDACANAGVLFHADAAQAGGRLTLDVRSDGIDLLSLSGHKMYGPMGVGALVIGASAAGKIAPLLRGGGQQGGLRPGTVPVPLVVGLGEACALAARRRAADEANASLARDAFLTELRQQGIAFSPQGDLKHRVVGNLNIWFHGCDAEILMAACPDVHCSAGSACTAGQLEPSHVLLALGLSRAQADGCLRFGFGRGTSPEAAIRAARSIATAVRRTCAEEPPRVSGDLDSDLSVAVLAV